MNKTVGIYHSRDLDGKCCGAIMKMKYPDIELIGYDYGEDDSSIFEVCDGADLVIMADVCLDSMDRMYELSKICKRFIWIDHHKSQIDASIGYDANADNWEAFLKEGVAACELCWEYFYPLEKLPASVFLLGKYDTWRKEFERGYSWDEVMDFQYGMRASARNSVEGVISVLSDTEQVGAGRIWEIMKDGAMILDYQDQVNRINAKYAHEATLFGLRAICLNTQSANSQSFTHCYDPERHDLMVCYRWKGMIWEVSLYSTKEEVDCSVLAKSKGGGGHKAAAGFQVNSVVGFLKK